MLEIAGGIILAIIILCLFGGMLSGFDHSIGAGVGSIIVWGTLLVILVMLVS